MAAINCSSPSSLCFKPCSFQYPNPRSLSSYTKIANTPLNLPSISLTSSFPSRKIIISSSKKLNSGSLDTEFHFQFFVPVALAYISSGFFMIKHNLSEFVVFQVYPLFDFFSRLPLLNIFGVPILPPSLLLSTGTLVLVNLMFFWAGLWSSLVSRLIGGVVREELVLLDDSGIFGKILALGLVILVAAQVYSYGLKKFSLWVLTFVVRVAMSLTR